MDYFVISSDTDTRTKQKKHKFVRSLDAIIYEKHLKAAERVVNGKASKWGYVAAACFMVNIEHIKVRFGNVLWSPWQKFGLQFKATLENVTNVKPEGDDFRWFLKVG